MLSSPYDILKLFETAFFRERATGAILQIDCSQNVHWAEGEIAGKAWRVEAQVVQTTPIDEATLRTAYAHMGEHLLLPFYLATKAHVHELGWRGKEAQQKIDTAMFPVLDAMRFHMGMALDKGWVSATYTQEFSGGVHEEPAPLNLEQLVHWSRLGQPGRWTTGELMQMLLSADAREHYFNKGMGDAWVASHSPEHQGVARRLLESSFALDITAEHCMVPDTDKAARAWKDWWMLMPMQRVQDSMMGEALGHGEAKTNAIVAGWYLRAAQSKKMGELCLNGMDDTFHGLPSTLAWVGFSRGIRHAMQAYPNVVWKHREAQAWLLHKVVRNPGLLCDHPAMANNRVHDFVVVNQSLDAVRRPHDFYPLWQQLQSQEAQQSFDTAGLLDDSGRPD